MTPHDKNSKTGTMLKLWMIVLLFPILFPATGKARHFSTKQKRTVINQCKESSLETVDVQLNDLTGIWYKVLCKQLPSMGNQKTSAIFKLERKGNHLNMTGYSTKLGVYRSGRGKGSMFSSSKIKKGLAAAAAGYITYKAGKALLKNAGRAVMYGGMSYYWGPRYYVQRDDAFHNYYIDENTRVIQMTFGCPINQYCCAMECCMNLYNRGMGGLAIALNDSCHGPFTGKWSKPSSGKLRIEITKKGGNTVERDVSIVYYYKHPHIDREKILAIYACTSPEADDTCKPENQVAAVISSSRHPASRDLFNAAKALQNVCLNPRTLRRLNTQTACGNQLLEEKDKHENGESGENVSDDPCLVENIRGLPYTLDDLKPIKLYMIAVHDGMMTKMGITMSTVAYKGERKGNKAKFHTRVIKHGVCYKGIVWEWVDPDDATVWRAKSNIRTPAGPTEIEFPFKIVYYKDGVSISYWCTKMDEMRPGRCALPRVAVMSGNPHIRLDQLILAFKKLKSICVEPRHMIFMNTHAQCRNPFDIATHAHDPTSVAEEDKCKVSTISANEHFSLNQLEGVWYLAAGVGSESVHANIRSAVVNRTKTGNANILNTRAYINFDDGSCVLFTGTTKLISAESGVVEHEIMGRMGGREKTIKLKQKVLHAGPQLVLYYWCKEENSDGTCKAPLVRLDTKTRTLRHRDVLNVKEHIEQLCIDLDSIKWFFLNSECGKEFDAPFKERHGYLALSHTDTMDIITKFSSPMCKVSDIKGVNVCLKKEDFTFYGSVCKMKYTGNGTMIAREFAVFNAGDGKTCHEALGTGYIANNTDRNDVIYLGKWSILGQEHSMNFKWIWTNYRIAVGYWCRAPASDGTCPRNKVSTHVIANYGQTMDHAEWLLIEQIMKSLCIDPSLLKHMSSHEFCLIEHAESGNSMYPPKQECNWDEFKGVSFTTDESEGTYHVMAYASKTAFHQNLKSRVFKMEKINDDSLKLTVRSTYVNDSEACREDEMILSKGDADSNQWVTSYTEINGQETSASIWLGHAIGPYTVLLGCTGTDCNEETGFVFIASDYRAQDKMAIQEIYQYLQDNCIDPDWLTFLDTHSECGASLDSRSCRVADFQALTASYNRKKFEGIWYLTVHTNQRYESMKCKVESGGNEKDITCYTKMGERCLGPSRGKFITDEATKPGQIRYSFQIHGKQYTSDYYLLYQDNNHLLMVGCQYLSGDGSCLSSRTSLMIWSKRPSVSRDSLPRAIFEKLESVCVHTCRLEYLPENNCGAELN